MTYNDTAYVEENDFGLSLATHLCIDTLENVFHWLILGEHSWETEPISVNTLQLDITKSSTVTPEATRVDIIYERRDRTFPQRGTLRHCRTSARLTGCWTRGTEYLVDAISDNVSDPSTS